MAAHLHYVQASPDIAVIPAAQNNPPGAAQAANDGDKVTVQIGGTARVLPELPIAQGDANDRRSPQRFRAGLP